MSRRVAPSRSLIPGQLGLNLLHEVDPSAPQRGDGMADLSAVRDILEECAGLVERLHGAGADAVESLEYLARRLDSAAALVVAARRSTAGTRLAAG